MSSVHAVRSQLFIQAAITALFGLRTTQGGGSWTIATMVVAAAAVFMGSAVQPLPAWRTYVIAFEAAAVAYGAMALVSSHYVPGTVVAIGMLIRLCQGNAALAFAGVPAAQTWAPTGSPQPAWTQPVPASVEQWAAPAPVLPPTPVAAPVFTPTPVPPDFEPTPVPVQAVPAEPVPAAPRPATMTILPGK